jgi:hypothetical protein
MKILTADLTELDAWSRPRTVTVEWIPEDITDQVDPARPNTASPGPIVAHGSITDPPAHLVFSSATGSVALHPVRQSWAGEFALVTEFRQVDDRAELAPGTWFVAADTDR